MIALMDQVVTLPNHLGIMNVKLLNHWQLVGFMRQGFFAFDLSTGTLKPVELSKLNDFVLPLRVEFNGQLREIYVTKCRTLIQEKYEEAVINMFLIEHETFPGARDSFKAVKLTDSGARFIRALAEFQVDGSEIVKGLKALGINVEVKIRKNFLGGWMMTSSDTFTDEENRCGISNVIEDYIVQSSLKGSNAFEGPVFTRDFDLYGSQIVED